MIGSFQNITEIRNDRNKFTIVASDILISQDSLVPIMAADFFAMHGDTAATVIIGHRTHDDSWWRPQMETFSALLALFAENSPVTSEFPS